MLGDPDTTAGMDTHDLDRKQLQFKMAASTYLRQRVMDEMLNNDGGPFTGKTGITGRIAVDREEVNQGYSRGMSSRMEAILKNQFRQVSFAVSFTHSGEKVSGARGGWGESRD